MTIIDNIINKRERSIFFENLQNSLDFFFMLVSVGFLVFNGISTFVDYLMPKSSLQKDSSDTIYI